MKKQEKHHLKEDPFISFMGKFFHFVHDNRRPIAIGAIIAAAVGLLLVGTLFLRSASISRSNQRFAQALKIKDDTVLTAAEKVERLTKLGRHKGIVAVAQLFIAQVYSQEQNWSKAEETIQRFSGSQIEYLNASQQIMLADIYAVTQKRAEAEKILQGLLENPRNGIGNDMVLLKLAKLKADGGQTEAAKTLLNQLLADFTDSSFQGEARELLTRLENT